MFRRNWGAILAAIGLASVSCGFGVFVTALHQSEKQQERIVAAYADRKDANGEPQQYLTSRSGIPAPIESVISNPQPTTGQDHEKRDLAAQEASATFAWWMVVVSIFGFLVTTIGTILLYQQIKLTREAVEDTGKATKAMEVSNAIAMLAQRPWVQIDVEIVGCYCRNQFLMVYYDVVFRNTGKTMAENFWPYITADAVNINYATTAARAFEEWRTPRGLSAMALVPGAEYRRSCRFGAHIKHIPLQDFEGRKRFNLVVASAAYYHLPGESLFDQRRFVEQTFRIGTMDDDPVFRSMMYIDKITAIGGFDLVVTKTHPSAGN